MARSLNNRAVVHFGLQKIRAAKRPCWQAILPLLKREACAEDLGFLIGPLLNSDGRLSDALGSVSFLLAKDLLTAKPWVETLWQQNQARKTIQQNITEAAMEAASIAVGKGCVSLVIYLPDGHAGVHGISASRVKDKFGRPTILFSPKEGDPNIITGSARSIDGVNARAALQWVAEKHPEIIYKFGGHKGAAGVAIYKQYFELFQTAFEEAVLTQIDKQAVGPILYTDGILPDSHFNLDFAKQLLSLDPYGREFEAPIFEAEADIVNLRLVGQNQNHAQLTLRLPSGQHVSAIWFGCVEAGEAFGFAPGQKVRCAFSVNVETFREQQQLKLMISYLDRLS
jgi:single-stranded-DNA-specific exonuclease